MLAKSREEKWLKLVGVLALIILAAAVFLAIIPSLGATNAPNTSGSSSVVSSGTGITKITSLDDLKPGLVSDHRQPNGNVAGRDDTYNYRNGNYINISDANGKKATSGGFVRNGCIVPTAAPISLKHSWKLTYDYYCSQVYDTKTRGNLVDVILNGRKSSGALQIRFSIYSHRPDSSTSRTQYLTYSQGSTINTTKKKTSASILNANKTGEITYNASTKKFTFRVIGNSDILEIASPFTSDTFTFDFGGSAYNISGCTISGEMKNNFTFKSFEYTDYNLQVTSTKFYDMQNRQITGAVGRIQDVWVEVKVKSNASAPFPARLRLEPAANPRIIPREGSLQSVKVNNTPIPYNASNCDIGNSAVGIPFTAGGETTIRYLATTPNLVDPEGTYLTLKHMVTDEYFYKTVGIPAAWKNTMPLYAQYNHSKHRLLFSDLQNKTSHDYRHNIRPNSHGWYNQNVTLTRSDTRKDFQELYYSPGGAYKSTTGSFTISNETPAAEAADGTPYWIYGRNTANNGLSGLIVENFKIDKTAPKIDSVSRSARTFKVSDALSGVEFVKVKRPGDADYTIFKTYTAATGGIGKNTDTVTFPVFPEIKDENGVSTGTLQGTYNYCITDMAGNTSSVVSLTNTSPMLSAKSTDKVVKFSDTKAGFAPAGEFQVSLSDKEETIPTTKIKWKIEKAEDAVYPQTFESINGTGMNNLAKALPIGRFKITFSMDGKDSDGNAANTQTTVLTVNADEPPEAHDNENDYEIIKPNGDPIIDRVTGAHHSSALASYVVFVADVQDRYGDEIDKNEAKEEIKRLYSFTSINAPFVEESLSIHKNGVDITNSGIDSGKEGNYHLIFRAEDGAGSSITLDVDYRIQEDCFVTFNPGKGSFTNKDMIRTETVKVGEKLQEGQLPSKEDIEAPVERAFIGWGKMPDSTEPEDVTNETINNNVTYYALFAKDLSRDGIDDREQALFQFQSSDTDKGAFKDVSKIIVGVTITEGSSAKLTRDKIPELLFERGYSLKGWRNDDDGLLLTVDQLCEKDRGKGSLLTCTAEFNYTTPLGDSDVYITFFSEHPKEAPLVGGDGQKLHKTATAVSPTYLQEDDIPMADISPGYKFVGWRTDENESEIISTELLTSRELYGGDRLTCIACFEFDPDAIDKDVTFTFFSNEPEKGSFNKGEGFQISKVSKNGEQVSLDEESIPKLKLSEGYELKGWKTDETGDTLLTTEQLCEIKQKGDTKLTCIAYIAGPDDDSGTGPSGGGQQTDNPDKPKDPDRPGDHNKPDAGNKNDPVNDGIKDNNTEKDSTAAPGGKSEENKILNEKAATAKSGTGSDTHKSKSGSGETKVGMVKLKDKQTSLKKERTSLLTVDGGEGKVPLGGAPEGYWKNRYGAPVNQCISHWIMLLWLIITAGTVIFRIRRRKHTEYGWYSDSGDYIFLIGSAIAGAVLAWLGKCILEIPILTVGIIVLIYYLIRMKMFDHKLAVKEQQADSEE